MAAQKVLPGLGFAVNILQPRLERTYADRITAVGVGSKLVAVAPHLGVRTTNKLLAFPNPRRRGCSLVYFLQTMWGGRSFGRALPVRLCSDCRFENQFPGWYASPTSAAHAGIHMHCSAQPATWPIMVSRSASQGAHYCDACKSAAKSHDARDGSAA